MKKATAEEMVVLAHEFGLRLTWLLGDIEPRGDDPRFKQTVKNVGYVLGALVAHIHEPMEHYYPELKPEHMGGTYVFPEVGTSPFFKRFGRKRLGPTRRSSRRGIKRHAA